MKNNMDNIKKVPVLRFPEFLGDWEVKKLGKLASFIKDGTHGTHQDAIDSEYYLLSAKNINRGKIFYDNSDRKISKLEFDLIYKNYSLKDGDILLTVVGSIGRVAIYSLEFSKVAFQRSVAFFRFDNENSSFIAQLFTATDFQKSLLTKQVVSAQAGVYLGDLAKIQIKIPLHQEQQKIADFLTQIDSKIEQLSKKKQLLERYKKGVMQNIFSQELRFKDDNGNAYPDWEIKRLGDVTKIYDGTHMTPDYKKEGIPFYSVEHLTSNNFFNTKFISKEVFEKENKRVKLEKGDILMTKIGDIGTSKYINWDVNASFYVSLALIKKTEINNTLFINQYIKSSLFQKELHKRIIHVAFPKKINLGEISHCLINFPCLEEQTKIANFLTELDQKISLVEKQLNGTKKYKKGLLQKMFV